MNPLKRTKKKVLLVTMIGVMVLSLFTGCQSDAYSVYQAATEKTESAQSGVYLLHFNVENTFDTEKATEEELTAINYLKSMTLQSTTTIDQQKDSLISEAFASVGGIGFDFTFYNQKDDMYLKYPVMKKYIDLKAMQATVVDANEAPMNFSISTETQERLKVLWKGLASEKNVTRGEKTALSLRGGVVKATQYQVTIEGDLLKKAMQESARLLAQDPQLVQQLGQALKQGVNVKTPEADKMNMASLVKAFDSIQIDQVTMDIFIDADGYVVREMIDVAYHNTNPSVQPSQTHFSLKMTNTQLNQPVEINMPEWTAENVYTKEELNKDMPALFKNLTK